MRELFERIEVAKDNFDTYIELSMVEIYNENIRDLLNDEFPACPMGGLKLLENEKERVRIDKVKLKRPESVEEVMELVRIGNERRSTSFTASNSVSSRSHAVLQINVIRKTHSNDVDLDLELLQQSVSSATLSIIDLAGSERAAATRNMGVRMKEGANINKSLLALSSCISALCQAPSKGQKAHVPYRNSKLTRMLKFSLGGNCRTVMIVCVSPSSKDIEDTHNTLVWADRAKNVSTKISRNTSGVSVSVAQYLATIAQQEVQIKILEKKLLEGPPQMSAYQQKKLDQARADVSQALQGIRSELDGNSPSIGAGATQRALWDGAELRSAALKRRIEAVEVNSENRSVDEIEREKQYLQSLIRQQDNAYRLNQEVQAAVQLEAHKADISERLFKTMEVRTFGDALEKFELEVVRFKVARQRDQVALTVAASREKGYRQVIQQQAEDSARAAALLHRLITSLTAETDKLTGSDETAGRDSLQISMESLRRLVKSSESALSSIFGIPSFSGSPLPPLPQPSQNPTKLRNPPRRQSTAPSNPQPGLRAAPNIRRILAAGKTSSSPRRLGRVAASPRKMTLRPILVTARDPAQTKKPLQWRDEAGKGDIDDSAIAPAARVFTSSSSSSSLTPPQNESSDASGEWDDEEETPPQPASGSLLPPTLPLVLPPKINPPVAAPKPFNLLQSAPTPSMAPPMPAWKKNRIFLGKTVGALGTLGEESSEQSSPESGPSHSRFRTMAPPVRSIRGPLSERHQLPQANASIFPTSGSSTLFKPTAASASRSNIFAIAVPSPVTSTSPSRRKSSIGRAPSSATKASKRSSNVGPYRRGRNSMLPLPSGSTSIFDTSLSSASIPAIPFSLTAAGAHHLKQTTANAESSDEGSRRVSVMGSAPGLPRPAGGPRPSTSMGTLPRVVAGGGLPSLNSRPSISRLSTFGGVAGLAGAGDSSTRAIWR